jgi:hypothetical protein
MSDSLEQLKSSLMGEWVSIAPELRPSATKNADGTIKPFYLRRDSRITGDRFELVIANSVDPCNSTARIVLGGRWSGEGLTRLRMVPRRWTSSPMVS